MMFSGGGGGYKGVCVCVWGGGGEGGSGAWKMGEGEHVDELVLSGFSFAERNAKSRINVSHLQKTSI